MKLKQQWVWELSFKKLYLKEEQELSPIFVGLRRATTMYNRAFEAVDDEQEQEEQEWWRRARTKMMKKRNWRVRNSRAFFEEGFWRMKQYV